MKNEKIFLNKLTIISLLMLCTLTFTSVKENEKGWENHPIDPVKPAGLEDLPIDLKGLEDLPIDLTVGLENLPIDPESLPIDFTAGLEDLAIDFDRVVNFLFNA